MESYLNHFSENNLEATMNETLQGEILIMEITLTWNTCLFLIGGYSYHICCLWEQILSFKRSPNFGNVSFTRECNFLSAQSFKAGRGGSAGCAVRLETRRLQVQPHRGRQHSFLETDHEIFSAVILSLPLNQEGQLSVSGERMCTILVNPLED